MDFFPSFDSAWLPFMAFFVFIPHFQFEIVEATLD